MKQDEAGDVDELALVQQAVQGNQEAFRRLIVSYEPRLLAYLTHMLGDAESARDVAQETFVELFRSLPGWRQLSPPAPSEQLADIETPSPAVAHPLAPWLYRIATNRAISLLRKKAVRLKTNAGSRSEAPYEYSSAHAPYPRPEFAMGAIVSLEDQFAARELLREALSHLAAEDAACLVLHFVAGERYGEIATRLGMSSEAVRKRVARALTTLRKVYSSLDMEAYS